jgi:Spy/CpxP family protein refolding chaperone
MKNAYLFFVAASLTVFAASSLALAQGENAGRTGGKMTRRVIARVEARLNITTDQRAQIQAIMKAEEPTILALSAQAKQEREAIAALPVYNEAQVHEIAQKYAATNTDIVVERAKIRLELRGILTEQQLQQLEKLKASVDGRFSERLDMVIGQL